MCPSGVFLIWLEVSVEAQETTWDLDENHVRRKRLRLDVLTTPCLRRVCNSSILNQSGLWQCPVTCPRCLPLLESHKCFIWIQICLQQHLPVKIFSSFTRLNHSPCCALLLPKTRSCADHGKLASVSIFGYNSRLSDLKRQALVVLVAYWDEWTRIDCETDPLPAQPQWNVDRLSGPLRC